MANDAPRSDERDWLEAIGLLHIFRTLGLALQPAKLSLALIAVVLTLLLGGILDWVWQAGNGGVNETAIVEFIHPRDSSQPYKEQSGDHGIFEVWRKHQQACVLGLLDSFVPNVSAPRATATAFTKFPMAAIPHAQPWAQISGVGLGIWWLVRYHFVFALLLSVCGLIIWSCAGGAICRLAAVQFAQDERLTLRQGYEYARRNLLSGFALAPCIPLALVLLGAFVLAAGGFVLRVPVIGDLLGGIAFVLAPLGGFMIAILLVGLAVGGSLFWPAVATECQDAYDAFARGFSYAFSKPWKTILYGLMMAAYTAICWSLVELFTLYGLRITRGAVRFGAGWWDRGTEAAPANKIDLLWPATQADSFYRWPEWSQLAWYECFSAFFIGLTILLVVALMWSFLASFYFSGSTVVYFLLRRDVDGTDIGDVQSDELDYETRPERRPATQNDSTKDPARKGPAAQDPGAQGPATQSPAAQDDAMETNAAPNVSAVSLPVRPAKPTRVPPKKTTDVEPPASQAPEAGEEEGPAGDMDADASNNAGDAGKDERNDEGTDQSKQ